MYPSARKYHQATYRRSNNRRKLSPENDFDWQAMTQPQQRPKSYGIDNFEKPKVPPNRQRSRQVPYPARRPPQKYTPRSRGYERMRSAPFKQWDELASPRYRREYDDDL